MKKSFTYIDNSIKYWINYNCQSNFSLFLPKADAGSIKKIMATHNHDTCYRVQMTNTAE